MGDKITKIENSEVGNGKPVHIIAEVGINHDGDMAKAVKLIQEAKKSGADSVKLQTYITEHRVPKDHAVYEILKQCELSHTDQKELFDLGKELGITIFSTPFDDESVDFLQSLNTPVYKIASFDIEASSSHGDFPLAKKDYKKLATNIIDKWDNETDNEDTLRSMILTAFKIPGYGEDEIEIVYPKTHINESHVNSSFNHWITINLDNIDISGFDEGEGEPTEERECDNEGSVAVTNEDEYAFTFKKKKTVIVKRGTVINWLNDTSIKRDIKLAKLTKSFDTKVENEVIFPPLKGDEVTFIGTTFLRYGEEEPYLNHCIAKDTCDKLPQVIKKLQLLNLDVLT